MSEPGLLPKACRGSHRQNKKMVSTNKEPCEQNPCRLNMFSCVTAGTIHDPAERCLRSAIRDPAERRHNKTANMKQHGRYPRPHGMTSALLDPLVLFPRETRTRLVDQSCLETGGSDLSEPGLLPKPCRGSHRHNEKMVSQARNHVNRIHVD